LLEVDDIHTINGCLLELHLVLVEETVVGEAAAPSAKAVGALLAEAAELREDQGHSAGANAHSGTLKSETHG
jgi:hypothetical protein